MRELLLEGLRCSAADKIATPLSGGRNGWVFQAPAPCSHQ